MAEKGIGRLVVLEEIDGAKLIYRVPQRGEVTAVFDGLVALERRLSWKADDIDGRVRLRFPPAHTVQALVYKESGEPAPFTGDW